MKNAVKICLFSILMAGVPLSAQVTLDWCQQQATLQYPLIAQGGLIEEAKQYSISAANTAFFPHVTLSGKATYQSEVTELPIALPGMTIDPLSKDQYQILAEINQTIWDGGVTGAQKRIIELTSEADGQKAAVELYALRDRVNQVFFGIMLLQRQLEQNTLLSGELRTNYSRLQAYRSNGIASTSDVDAVGVELLHAEQTRLELASSLKAYRDMLSRMTGSVIEDSMTLVQPSIEIPAQKSNADLRPEMNLFAAQEKLNGAQKDLLVAASLPKLGAFVQAGYGKPGLNMLKNDFSTFYITGVRFSWALDGMYTLKSNLDKVDVSRRMLSLQRETFAYNTRLKSVQQQGDIDKLQALIKSDEEIIALRTGIKKAAETRLANGTATVNDLLREITAENLAMQKKSLHEIQLLLSVYNLKFTLNN